MDIISKFKNFKEKIQESMIDDIVFYRHENIELFNCVKRHLSDCIDDNAKSIKGVHLKKISQLEIKENIKTLNCIEKLPNLTHLTINGYDAVYLTNKLNLQLRQCYAESNNENEFDARSKIIRENIEKEKTVCQLKDFSAIENCKTLTYLSLKNQKNLTELNLSNLKNLNYLDLSGCVNLKSIEGIIRGLDVEKRTTKKYIFHNCFSLKYFKDIDLLYKNIVCPNYLNEYLISLPTTTYSHLNHMYPKHMEKIFEEIKKDAKKDPFRWTERINDVYYVYINTMQAHQLSEETNQIIGKFKNNPNLSSIEKIKEAYKWVCNNISYDYENLSIEKAGNANNEITLKMRNSYQTYLRRCGVCAGISNYFNFMLAEMGYDARPCPCYIKSPNANEIHTIINHQMTRIDMQTRHNETSTYFCDPTRDLGKTVDNFLFTKEEILNARVLTAVDENVEETPMLRDKYLYDCLFSVSGRQKSIESMEK